MTTWEKRSLLVGILLVGLPTLYLSIVAATQQSNTRVAAALAVAAVGSAVIIAGPPKLRISWPLAAGTALQLMVTLTIFSAYDALPDVDPYHWVKSYQTNFAVGSIMDLPQRPLFHATVAILDASLPANAEQVFKYALPLLSLTVLIPVWLVAQRLPSKRDQFIVMLYPSLSPALIINTQMGTPQALLLISMSFFTFFLLYAWHTKQRLWHNVAGLMILVATGIHGLALLVFAIWASATIWRSRFRMLVLLALLLIAGLSIPYARHFIDPVLHDVRLNLTFPAAFTTIDAVSTGWPGLTGAMQYYGFYAGPALLVLLVYTIRQLSHPATRTRATTLLQNPSVLALFTTLCVFISIAELLPRAFNIVILPERAWLMIAAVSPVLPVLVFSKSAIPRSSFVIAIAAISISIGGALYLNNMKQHSIPDYLVSASRWIGNNTSKDSTVLSNYSPDYLDLYTRTPLRRIPSNLLCEIEDNSENTIQQVLEKQYNNPSYIFLARPDTKHPYTQRPWYTAEEEACVPNTLANTSEQFELLYQDDDRARIWRINR